jgi:cupin fold WbuC family metalloprotein
MKVIDKALLDSISDKAAQSERLRMNYNFHQHLDDKVQRLLNALEPGTIMPIHRHLHTDEMYIVLRGKMLVKSFNNLKEEVSSIMLCPAEGSYGVSIAAGEWHTIEVLEKGTIIFEIKEGPYAPLSAEDVMNL